MYQPEQEGKEFVYLYPPVPSKLQITEIRSRRQLRFDGSDWQLLVEGHKCLVLGGGKFISICTLSKEEEL